MPQFVVAVYLLGAVKLLGYLRLREIVILAQVADTAKHPITFFPIYYTIPQFAVLTITANCSNIVSIINLERCK